MSKVSITLGGISQAVDSLRYRPGSVKYKAIKAIQSFYPSDTSIQEVQNIDTDTLIPMIWEVGDDPRKLRSKRRNFSSIKSAINADLGKLVKKDQNPENIIISETNVFDMTEEAKTNLLYSFTDAVKTGDIDLDKATSVLKAVTEFLETIELPESEEATQDIVDEIKKVLSKMGGRLFQGDGEGEDDLEEVEIEEDDEIEEIEEDEDLDVEEIELDEDEELEEIELDEDEDLEEIELDEDQEIEEIEEEDLEDQDVEEIELDEDEELEEIEIDEDEEIETLDEEDLIDEDLVDDDVEEIELDEDEEIEEIEDDLEDQDVEEIELDEDEDLEEIEIDEDEEIEEIELDEDQNLEDVELDEDEELEEVEEVDEDDIEEIDLDDDEEIEEVEGIELDEDEEIEEIQLGDDEDLEELDELDEDEQQALEDFRESREMAEHFDDTLGDRERKYNAYIKIPEGIYTIGTKKSLKSSLELQQFHMPLVYLARYPVTNSLFEIFVEQTGYETTAEKKGFGTVYHARYEKKGNRTIWKKQAGLKEIKGACWYQPSGPGSSLHGKRNHPVVQVSVADAFSYASWIGRRLPSESEWEAAARTDLGLRYPWGNSFDPPALNIEGSGISDTTSVDAYDAFANEFGVTDMLGNIMEWTQDSEYPPFKTRRKEKYNVAKGGAWNASESVTISSRGLYTKDFTSNTIGFRCISELFQ